MKKNLPIRIKLLEQNGIEFPQGFTICGFTVRPPVEGLGIYIGNVFEASNPLVWDKKEVNYFHLTCLDLVMETEWGWVVKGRQKASATWSLMRLKIEGTDQWP